MQYVLPKQCTNKFVSYAAVFKHTTNKDTKYTDLEEQNGAQMPLQERETVDSYFRHAGHL